MTLSTVFHSSADASDVHPLRTGEVLVRIMATPMCPPIDRPVPGVPAREALPSIASRSGLAGVVEVVASGLVGLVPGDEVFGVTTPHLLHCGTGFAVLSASRLAHKPRRLDFAQAALLPTAAVTAWQMLFGHGRLDRGETVVILGAERPVGIFAVQMARAHGIRNVVVAASRNARELRARGADLVIDAGPRVLEVACSHAGVVIDAIGNRILLQRALGALSAGSLIVSSALRPAPALLARTNVKFELCVPDVTTLRLRQVAALVDLGLLTPAFEPSRAAMPAPLAPFRRVVSALAVDRSSEALAA